MKVDVYWNLHRRLFSIRSRERGSYGRVISHAPFLGLYNPRPVVSEAGRQRVIREGRKNVHAVIRGELDMDSSYPGWAERFCWDDHDQTYQWMYNPYTMDDFQFDPHRPYPKAPDLDTRKGSYFEPGCSVNCSNFKWGYALLKVRTVARNELYHRTANVIGGMTK